MRCPYCKLPVHPSLPECPSCHLTYPRTKALLGAFPRLAPRVADTTSSLRPREQARLRRRIEQLERRFPELVLQVVVHRFPTDHPLSLYVFWIFNAGSFAGEVRRGRDNHALLLAVDPARGEAAIMPGYGLEPFLAADGLDHLLELAAPAWQNERWLDGIERVLDGFEPWLESIATPVDETEGSGGEW